MDFKYSRNYVIDNLNEVLEIVPHSYFVDKADWYVDTHNWCKDLSEKIDIPLIPVIGTFAALSPQTSVKFNKIFTESYYNGFEKHTKSCIDKCNRINALYGYLIDDEETQVKQVMSFLNGKKTVSFCHNILYPFDSQRVTIDRWMIKIAGFNKLSITNKQYDFLENCYKEVASERNMLPLRLQSILWTYHRDVLNKSNKYD